MPISCTCPLIESPLNAKKQLRESVDGIPAGSRLVFLNKGEVFLRIAAKDLNQCRDVSAELADLPISKLIVEINSDSIQSSDPRSSWTPVGGMCLVSLGHPRLGTR